MSEPRRRRTDARQADRIPPRVENAAQNMNAASGPRRGYVPEAYATGRQQPVSGYAQATGRQQPMPGYAQATGRQPAMNVQPGYQPGPNAYQQPVYQQTASQQSFYTGQQAKMTGAQRGFRVTTPPPPPKPKKKKRSPVLAVVLIVFLVAGLATGGYFYVQNYQRTREIDNKVTPYDALFCPGVYVDGIALEGMSPQQAMNSVQSQIRQRHDAWSVQLTYQGETLATVNSDMMNFNVDPSQVLNEAWSRGHTGDREQRYADMLQLEAEPYVAYTAQPTGDTQAIDSMLSQIKARIDKPATDAVMTAFDPSQAYPFLFTEETYGLSLDTEPLKTRLYEMVSTLESGALELQPQSLEPAVRKADLMVHYMLRSSVYTPIDRHSTENRNNNIRKALEIVNGYILKPGKTFSFNGVVGERTEQNGFYPAIEYVYGEHVEGFGGGVCQASTTLYQAAVCAGLQIVKREPHSDSVSYADYGKDATVYWVGKRKIDLSFKNNTDEDIYIVSGVQQDPSNKKRLIAKVTIYGQDMGDVRYELTSEVVEVLPAPFEPEYVKDTNGTYVTYRDQQESVSKAKEGYVVKSYRVEYTGNVETGRMELYTDTYKPKAERIYVGVKNRD